MVSPTWADPTQRYDCAHAGVMQENSMEGDDCSKEKAWRILRQAFWY